MHADILAGGVSAVADLLANSTVAVRSRHGGGAGVVWSTDGTIITNAHVIRDSQTSVTFDDGRDVPAVLVRRDIERDLAMLHVDARNLEPAAIRDPASVRAGEVLIAIGFPHGTRGCSTGIAYENGRRGGRFVAADLRLAPGNSGGPLADATGRVIGINSMIAGGLAFAVPSDAINAFVNGGTATQRLGVRYAPATLANNFVLVVTDVEDGSTAERSGLLAGDCIAAIDGVAIAQARLNALGASRVLDIRRGGQWTRVNVERGTNDVAA